MFYCRDKNNGFAGSKAFRQKFGDGFIDECTAIVVEVNMVVGMCLLRINSCVAQAVVLLDVYSYGNWTVILTFSSSRCLGFRCFESQRALLSSAHDFGSSFEIKSHFSCLQGVLSNI